MTVRCSRCGQDNPPEARFCGNCGSALTGAEPPSPGMGTLQTAPAAFAGIRYAGFWRRAGASTVDSIVIWVGGPLTDLFQISLLGATALSGGGLLFLLSLLYPVLFIGLLGQTPGKMLLGVRVVNQAGLVPGIGRAALREIVGKFLSGIALGLGFLWVAWDREKRGWHDHIAGTYVVRTR